MIKKFAPVLLSLLSFPISGFADTQDTAVEIVACINSANGYADNFEGDEWELPQAVLEMPNEQERFQLVDGYHLVVGRMLGWHGTWAAFLDLRDAEYIAFETRDENDNSAAFAESYVPVEVVEAFLSCGTEWGGYWTGKGPFIEVVEVEEPIAPRTYQTQQSEPMNGVDLLPPKLPD